jgi:hypothetical protein
VQVKTLLAEPVGDREGRGEDSQRDLGGMGKGEWGGRRIMGCRVANSTELKDVSAECLPTGVSTRGGGAAGGPTAPEGWSSTRGVTWPQRGRRSILWAACVRACGRAASEEVAEEV